MKFWLHMKNPGIHVKKSGIHVKKSGIHVKKPGNHTSVSHTSLPETSTRATHEWFYSSLQVTFVITAFPEIKDLKI
jgi:hypothetical protein